MAEVSEVLVMLNATSMLLLVFPPCREIGAAHCAGIDPNRNVHNLYFPHIQKIPFECIKKAQLPNRRQLAYICTRKIQRPWPFFSQKVLGKTRKSLD